MNRGEWNHGVRGEHGEGENTVGDASGRPLTAVPVRPNFARVS